jgi:transcriptional regulator with XRE-family HTH domain
MPRQVGVIPEIVAQNLRVAQAVSRVSNVQLAKTVGVSPRTVGKWRRGDIDISIASLEKVALALDRDVAWFLQGHQPDEAAA